MRRGTDELAGSEKLIREKLNETVGLFRFSHMDYEPERLMLFILISSTPEQCGYAAYIEKYAETALKNGYVHILELHVGSESAEDGLAADFSRKMEEIAAERAVRNANCLSVIPVFIQDAVPGAADDSQLCQCFGKACEKMMRYLQELHVTKVSFWPSAILKSTAAREHAYFLSCIRSWRSRTDFGGYYCNHTLVLCDRDSDNLAVSSAVIAQTLLMTIAVLAKDTQSEVTQHGDEDHYIFTARSFSICMPIHLDVIRRAVHLLEWFLTEPQDHNERMCALGKELAMLPQSLWWEKTWKRLPFKEYSINTEPLRSFCFPDSMTDGTVRKELEHFQNEYYLSCLPVEKEFICSDENVQQFEKKFWWCYLESYGGYLKGLTEIFEQGRHEDFVNQFIPLLNVIPVSETPGTDKGVVEQAEERLQTELRKRTQTLYKVLLSSDHYFTSRMQKRLLQVNRNLQELRMIMQKECNYWMRRELNLEQNDIWQEDDRTRLMQKIAAVFQTEDENITLDSPCMKDFMTELLALARNTFKLNTKEYLRQLTNDFEQQQSMSDQAELWMAYRAGRDCFAFQKFQDEETRCEWHFIHGPDTEELCLKIKALHQDRPFRSFRNRVASETDRVEVVRVSLPLDCRTLFSGTANKPDDV